MFIYTVRLCPHSSGVQCLYTRCVCVRTPAECNVYRYVVVRRAAPQRGAMCRVALRPCFVATDIAPRWGAAAERWDSINMQLLAELR